MKLAKFKGILGATVLIACSSMYAVESVYKTGANNFSGVITSTAKALDRYTGSLYIGSDGEGGGDGNYALAYAGRSDTSFTALATDTDLTGSSIKTIALLRTGGNNTAATHVAFITTNTGRTVHSLNVSDKTFQQAGVSGGYYLTDNQGGVADELTYMTTSSNHAFVRVVATGGNEPIAKWNGLANVSNSPFMTVQGDDTTSSTLLSRISLEVAETDSLNELTVSDMAWDPDIERLFITCTIVVPNDNTGYALVKGKFNTTDTSLINLEKIIKENSTTHVAYYSPRTNDDTAIFAFSQPAGNVATQKIILHKVRVMTTSTGLKYLILNGSVNSGNDVEGDRIYSLRISYTGSGDLNPGDIIRHDIYNETHLPNDYNNTDHVIGVTVGGSEAFWDTTISVSDMEVVGDAVYVSVVGNPGRTGSADTLDYSNKIGILKSQALFDHEGKIVAWTPWENVFPTGIDNTTGDDVPFFDVDAKTGKIWRGSGGDDAAGGLGKAITRTKWDLADTAATSLQYQLANNLGNGCFCSLDLTVSTTGIAVNDTQGHNSFVLFGGIEKVAFARTTQGLIGATTTDFSAAADFLVTGPDDMAGAGAVRTLGYSYNATRNQGYFFAGTDKGLFAYAKGSGAGYNADLGLTALNSGELFQASDSSVWQRVASNVLTSTVAISQIVTTTADAIHFIVKDTQTINGIDDRLYEMQLADSITTMVPKIIARSGQGGLPDNAVFSGCAIITTTNYLKSLDISTKPLIAILSTNDGLWTSTCDVRHLVGAQGTGVTISGTEWLQISATNNIPMHSLHNIKRNDVLGMIEEGGDYQPFRNTSFYGLPFIDDTRGLGLFENSTILQAGLDSAALANFADAGNTQPVQANPSTTSEAASARRFALNSDSTNFSNIDFAVNLYNEGGRRFFARFSPTESGVYSSIRMLPYNATEWNMTTPAADGDLGTVTRVHFIENISGLGKIVAGTDSGVIFLE
ncbi:hypothetical protein KAW80_03185 [Candidatus Babeliales bacterium]|nr:hypothetical protein [Candidatus Babeliales bacterium]